MGSSAHHVGRHRVARQRVARQRVGRRVLGTLAVLTIALGAWVAAPVAAQDYPPTPSIDVDEPIIPEGGIVTLSGSGYLPNSVVCLCITGGPANFAQVAGLASTAAATQSQEEQAIATCLALGGTVIGTTTTDANGNWSFAWDTGPFPPGDYTLVATDGTNTLPIEVVVTPPVGPTTTTTAPGPGPGPTSVPGPVPTTVVPAGPGLPQTGGIDQGPLRLGAVLLAIGGLVLLAVRNRRPTAHPRRS